MLFLYEILYGNIYSTSAETIAETHQQLAGHMTAKGAHTEQQTFRIRNPLQVKIRDKSPFHQFQVKIHGIFNESAIAATVIVLISKAQFTSTDPCLRPFEHISAYLYFAISPSQQILCLISKSCVNIFPWLSEIMEMLNVIK